jgi:hypothetical protein
VRQGDDRSGAARQDVEDRGLSLSRH